MSAPRTERRRSQGEAPTGWCGRTVQQSGEGVAWNEGRKKGEREEGHTTRNVSLRPNMPRIPRVGPKPRKGKTKQKPPWKWEPWLDNYPRVSSPLKGGESAEDSFPSNIFLRSSKAKSYSSSYPRPQPRLGLAPFLSSSARHCSLAAAALHGGLFFLRHILFRVACGGGGGGGGGSRQKEGRGLLY